MNKPMSPYPAISRYLSPWLEQLRVTGTPADYRVIVSEMEEAPLYQESLARLDEHVLIASQQCANFDELLLEKRALPPGLDEANKTVLDKLAEVRAVVGLSRIGFTNIRFARSPDLVAQLGLHPWFIEVTRLGSSVGKRSEVWDKRTTVAPGVSLGEMYAGGRAEAAISEAIYREVEEKYAQLRNLVTGLRLIWISLGRDYFTAGKYELPGVGLLSKMSTAGAALELALRDLRATGTYEKLSHLVLSPGRDQEDLVAPEFGS